MKSICLVFSAQTQQSVLVAGNNPAWNHSNIFMWSSGISAFPCCLQLKRNVSHKPKLLCYTAVICFLGMVKHS